MNKSVHHRNLRKQLLALSSTYYELAMEACAQQAPDEVHRMISEQRKCIAQIRRLEMMYPAEEQH